MHDELQHCLLRHSLVLVDQVRTCVVDPFHIGVCVGEVVAGECPDVIRGQVVDTSDMHLLPLRFLRWVFQVDGSHLSRVHLVPCWYEFWFFSFLFILVRLHLVGSHCGHTSSISSSPAIGMVSSTSMSMSMSMISSCVVGMATGVMARAMGGRWKVVARS